MTSEALLPGIQHQHNLKPFNTLNVAARARYFFEVSTVPQLSQLLSWYWQQQEQLPLLVVGGGSNLVLSRDFPGLVILNRILGIEPLEQSKDGVLVKVGAGENWDDFVAFCLQQGWYGLENLSAIPGTVGAAPIQNIGAYGVELCAAVERVEYLERATGKIRTLSKSQCQFGYRDSIFKRDLKNQTVITAVVFKLSTQPNLQLQYGDISKAIAAQGLAADRLTAEQVRQMVVSIRAKKLPDPKTLPNVGSFFKNPIVSNGEYARLLDKFPELVSYPSGSDQRKLAAGWMIDHLGWKGQARGDAKVHDRQALVLVNLGQGSADLLALAQAIQNDVKQHFGVWLEPEPNIV